MWHISIYMMLLFVRAHATEDYVSVVTPVGTVRGNTTSEYGDFVMFRGVPYAKINESDPFGPASSYPNFTTPYEAYTDPPVCPQIPDIVTHDGVATGDIQCLCLNIYTPQNATANSTLPVMVYIHGGSYAEGNSNVGTYPPTFFMKHDIILVMVHYRLGPYGFLCLPELGYSNQGIKDMILALKWIKDNISSFGGDEENVLLFGNSSGSHAVDLLLLFNKEDLFSKVILQSGQIVSSLGYREPANATYVAKLAETLAIDTTNLTTAEIMTQLSNVNTTKLINATRADSFSPCIDDIFITETPENVNLTGKKIMTGTNSQEMLCFFLGEQDSYLTSVETFLSTGFNNLTVEATEEVEDYYLPEDTKANAIDFGTDFVFIYPNERSVRYYLNNSAVVYRYVFSYDGGRNFLKVKFNITEAGASHADELGYIWNMTMFGNNITEADSYVVDAMTTMWTNFAKYGNPTPEITDVITTLWPEMTEDCMSYLSINTTLSVLEDLRPDEIDFWDTYYDQYGNDSRGFNLGEEYVRSDCDLNLIDLVLELIFMIETFISGAEYDYLRLKTEVSHMSVSDWKSLV